MIDDEKPHLHLGKALAELSGGRQPNRVICTGHSLGGALATLGAAPLPAPCPAPVRIAGLCLCLPSLPGLITRMACRRGMVGNRIPGCGREVHHLWEPARGQPQVQEGLPRPGRHQPAPGVRRRPRPQFPLLQARCWACRCHRQSHA